MNKMYISIFLRIKIGFDNSNWHGFVLLSSEILSLLIAIQFPQSFSIWWKVFWSLSCESRWLSRIIFDRSRGNLKLEGKATQLRRGRDTIGKTAAILYTVKHFAIFFQRNVSLWCFLAYTLKVCIGVFFQKSSLFIVCLTFERQS